MADKSTFGAEPERVDRLLAMGLEESGSDEDASAKVGWDQLLETPGGRIGRYKLLRVLGEGGMGIVYLAEQEHPIKRTVALKVVKPGMDSKRVIARFEAERQALALLDHPNIAHVYDAGTTESGRPYFAMEYVEGLPITEHCDRQKLAIEDRLNLFLQLCHAVHHAHQKGIIHRDIKPSNILVSLQDEQALPKIIDFGVAKALAEPLTERTLITEEGRLFGTPEYMSPEQADMASEDIDTRSDIYSLGVLLYVLLTGVLPFDSATLREGGIEHVRKVILETDPKTPSTRLTKLGQEAKEIAENRRTEIRTLAKHLHRELEWIPLKAMRKERTERYRSASELADDIGNYLKGAPLIAGPPSTTYRLKKFVRRNRALVTGIAAVLIVLMVGVVGIAIFAIRAERQANIAQAVSDFLRNDLIASAEPGKAKGRDTTILSFLDIASENLNGKFKSEPLVEASIRDTLGWTYRMLGELKAAELHLERALKLRQEHLGAEHPDTLESMARLGWVFSGQKRHREAERLWAKTFEIRLRVLGDEHPKTLNSMKFLGQAYMNLGRYDEAEQLLSKVVQTSRRVLGEQNVNGLGRLGALYERQGRYDEAEALYLKQLETSRRKVGDEHQYTLAYMRGLAGIYTHQGRYSEAEAQFLKTLEIERRVLGEEHGYTLGCVNGLAQLYTEQGRYDEAESLYEEALNTGKGTPASIDGLAFLYTKQKRYDEAEALFNQSLEEKKHSLGEDHPETLETKNDLAVLYKEQARYDEAEPLLLEAANGRIQKLKLHHPHTRESIDSLIELYEACNKPEKADKWRAKLLQAEAVEE